MKLIRKIGTLLGYSIISIIVAWVLFLLVGMLLITSIITVEWLTEVLR